MEDKDDRIDEWRERTDNADAEELKRVLSWVETYGEKHELSEEEVEVASVLARRRLRDAEDALPKEVARAAVREAQDEA